MSLTPSEINQILAALQDSEWDEATVAIGDVRIAVARGGAEISVSSGPRDPATNVAHKKSEAGTAEKAEEAVQPLTRIVAPTPTEGITIVTSPSVGLFWRSPEPGAPPFASEGSEVKEGDILCIIEIMKLMMNVTSTVSGTVQQFHLENGSTVEFGSPLISILSNEK